MSHTSRLADIAETLLTAHRELCDVAEELMAPHDPAPNASPARPTTATGARTPELASEPTPAASDAHTGTQPLTLPTVDEVAQAILGTFSDEPWEGLREYSRLRYRSEARAVLDLIAARVPVWQPVELGTVIKAGTHCREEYAYDPQGECVSADEWIPAGDHTVAPDTKGRVYIDPRTVPAEPEDPAVAVVEEWLARETNGSDWAPVTDLLARIDAARADA